MDKVLIDLRNENKWIREQFNTDLITVEELMNRFNDLLDDLDALREKIKDMQTPEEKEWVMVDDWYEKRNS